MPFLMFDGTPEEAQESITMVLHVVNDHPSIVMAHLLSHSCPILECEECYLEHEKQAEQREEANKQQRKIQSN